MKDYYKILDIKKEASGVEIKKAYREKAKKSHPDTRDAEDSSVKMKDLNEAYNILNDEFSKKQYDLRYPFYFEDDNKVFYENVTTANTPRSYYEEWKEDAQYRKIMLYLWILLGVVISMAVSLFFAFSALEANNSDSTPPAAPKDIKPDNLSPREIYEPYVPEEKIKEI